MSSSSEDAWNHTQNISLDIEELRNKVKKIDRIAKTLNENIQNLLKNERTSLIAEKIHVSPILFLTNRRIDGHLEV